MTTSTILLVVKTCQLCSERLERFAPNVAEPKKTAKRGNNKRNELKKTFFCSPISLYFYRAE